MNSMQVPKFLGPALPLPKPQTGLQAFAVGTDSDEVASFALATQLETHWCWASVAQSISQFRGQIVTQVEVATYHIQSGGQTFTCDLPPERKDEAQGVSCSINSCDTACNGFHSLKTVLQERGRFSCSLAENSNVSWSNIKDEVRVRRSPVPCRIGWFVGGQPKGGHFVCIFGWAIDAAGDKHVFVYDPMEPGGFTGAPANRQEMLFDDFLHRYPSLSAVGRSTHAYAVS